MCDDYRVLSVEHVANVKPEVSPWAYQLDWCKWTTDYRRDEKRILRGRHVTITEQCPRLWPLLSQPRATSGHVGDNLR